MERGKAKQQDTAAGVPSSQQRSSSFWRSCPRVPAGGMDVVDGRMKEEKRECVCEGGSVRGVWGGAQHKRCTRSEEQINTSSTMRRDPQLDTLGSTAPMCTDCHIETARILTDHNRTGGRHSGEHVLCQICQHERKWRPLTCRGRFVPGAPILTLPPSQAVRNHALRVD